MFEHFEKDVYAKTRLYAAASIVQYLLKTLSPKSTWGDRLREHMETFPGGPGIDVTFSGFPQGWSDQALWKVITEDVPVG